MTTVSTNTAAYLSGAVSARRFGLLKTVSNMVQLHKERRALAALSTDELADMGISQHDAMVEASRSLWDAPVHWHK